MKLAVVLAVLACVAMVSASTGYGHGHGHGHHGHHGHGLGYGHGYGYYRPGLYRGYHGVAAPYNNAERQLYVNKVAEHKGASTGTAEEDGVPGTGKNFGYFSHHGYGRPYAHGHHGHHGY